MNFIVTVRRYARIDIEALIKYKNNYCGRPRILTRIDRIRRINGILRLNPNIVGYKIFNVFGATIQTAQNR